MSEYEGIIISKLRDGDKHILKSIYKLYYPRLFYFAVEYVQDKYITENIINDSFLTLWNKRKLLKENTNLNAYLYTITKNKCLNFINRELVKERLTDSLSDYFTIIKDNREALSIIDTSELSFDQLEKIVNETIESLPKQCKKIFLLSRYDNLKNREIADELNISIKSVESQICKALKILRIELKDYAILFMFLFQQ